MRRPIGAKAELLQAFLAIVICSTACADLTELESFVRREPTVVLGSVSAGPVSVAILAHASSLRFPGVVFGDVAIVQMTDVDRMGAVHIGRLSSSHVPGYVDQTAFVIGMIRADRSGTELCYIGGESARFRAFSVPARAFGSIVIWDNLIFYTTEHFEDNIHFVDIETGEVHVVEGSGDTAVNSEFWIVDGELIVTDGGDKGDPYRLDINGLYPAPDVVVSAETKVGFNLRDIRDGEGLHRFEELLGIE